MAWRTSTKCCRRKEGIIKNIQMISKRFLEVIEIISKSLENEKIKWVLIGSSNLALQGVKINQKDIDILTDKKGAYQINKLLKNYKVKPVKFGRSEIFESYLGEFEIKNVKIEIMGDLKEKINDK